MCVCAGPTPSLTPTPTDTDTDSEDPRLFRPGAGQLVGNVEGEVASQEKRWVLEDYTIL